MVEKLPITVVILLQDQEDVEALEASLKTLSWASEVFIADSKGVSIDFAEMTQTISLPIVHFPFIGLSEELLRYRSALSSTSTWILFLAPGDQVTPEVQSELALRFSDAQTMPGFYRFPRRYLWQDIHWAEADSRNHSDLVHRNHAIENVLHLSKSPIHSLNTSLDHHIQPDYLWKWIQQAAQTQTSLYLETTGFPQINAKFAMLWMKSLFSFGITEGLLKRRLFSGPRERMSLFIQLVQTHLKWFMLYRYRQS